MSELPPRARLARVASALAKRLPEALAPLLDAPRFDAERPALTRLAEPDHARAAAAAMSEPEAAWLADLLLERWSVLSHVSLDPLAAIVAPEQVWIGNTPVKLTLQVAVDGLEPGWRARWDGDRIDDQNRHASELSLELPRVSGAPPSDLAVRVAVEGRAGGSRVLLIDQRLISVRVPLLVISDDRLQVLIRDQLERPAPNVRVSLAGAEHRTDAHGVVRLERPAEPGTEIHVEGVTAGRVPGRGVST